MSDYKKLKVWEDAHKFTVDIYNITQKFPNNEQYGLTSQIRRSASSIPTNIVEGCGQLAKIQSIIHMLIALIKSLKNLQPVTRNLQPDDRRES